MGVVTPRQPRFEFPANIPRHWLAGSAFRSHLLNSFTLAFPPGEMFFIRTLKAALPQVRDPRLRVEADAFIRQEAQHAVEHRKYIHNLTAQGFPAERIERAIGFVIRRVLEPRFSHRWRLSITAGLEHFTALLAEIGLREQFLAEAHPVMRELFEWHAAEEIEHRAVAYDVLSEVDDDYALRVGGLLIAYIILSGISTSATVALLAHEGTLLERETLAEAGRILFTRERLFPKSLVIALRYLAPGFHPRGGPELDHLANAVLESA